MPADPDPLPWTVYYRPSRRFGRWTPVGAAPSFSEAVGLIGVGGRRGGDWLLSDRPTPPGGDSEGAKPCRS